MQSVIRTTPGAMGYARTLIRQVCHVAGQVTCIDDLRYEAIEAGLVTAVESHDTPVIFDWLMRALTYQGISDAVAEGYMSQHGNVTWAQIAAALGANPECEKLGGYWTFTGCRYQKGSQTCAEPDQFSKCQLPRHRLRNGRLNQTAYSLFLFIRDIADSDIVGWIDRQLENEKARDLTALRASLMDPLRHVYGISDKVIAMVLSGLLIGAAQAKPSWFEVGSSFIVVDTLVHNFLHRTGILQRFRAHHPYGPGCYRPDGCADVLSIIAKSIDARAFNPAFPKVFPRFIQHAVWRYCAQSGLDICNGNQIDDAARCANIRCRLYRRCDRIALNPNRPKALKTAA